MASLESHYGKYRFVFRLGGQKIWRSLKIRTERTARAALARLEDNLARLEMGQLLLPPEADPVALLLSDGRLAKRPTIKLDAFRTLGELLDAVLSSLTPGALEATTEHCVRVHVRHIKRMLGEKMPLRLIDFAAVQAYLTPFGRPSPYRARFRKNVRIVTKTP